MPDISSPRHGDDEGSAPLVSVVLPVFNGEEFVAAAVESALSQTGVDLEVIVVDDGSTDGTGEVLASFGDSRLRIVRLPENRGLIAALNRGVQEARGELIARLDADDLALPGRLAAQVEVFAADPSVELTACAYDRVLPSGDLVRRAAPPATHGALAMAGWSGNRLCHSAVMFRRSTVLALGGYRVEWYPVEDFDLWLRLLEAGRYRGTSFVGTRYLVNPEGISLQQEQRQLHLVGSRSAEFTTSLLGEQHPLTGTVRQQLRHLDRFRVALHRHLAAVGESADGVDAMAYQLSFETVGAGSPVVRHLRVATAVPALWRAGRQTRSR